LSDDLEPVNAAFMADFGKAHPGADHKPVLEKLLAKLEGYKLRFHKYDADGSGDLDLDELQRMLRQMETSLTKQELVDLVSKVDDDNSGTIRYSEFVNMMLIHEKILTEPLQPQIQTMTGKDVAKLKKRGGARRKQRLGHIHVDVGISQAGGGTFTVTARVIGAKGLTAQDMNGYSDPYTELCLITPGVKEKKADKKKTKVVKKNLHPEWNETITFTGVTAADLTTKRLHVSVWDWDRITANDFMGSLSWSLEEVQDASFSTAGWFMLLDGSVGRISAVPSRKADLDMLAAQASAKKAKSAKGGKKGAAAAGVAGAYVEKDFNYLKVLGRGSFGKVFYAEEKKTGAKCALKVLRKSSVISNNDINATLSEKHVLALPSHAFLCGMKATFQTATHLFFVMDLVTGGDLMFHVLERKSFTEAQTKFYIAEIFLGLAFLHEHDIIYRDLKLDNILLDNEGHARIADFGLSRDGVPYGSTTTTFCGTPDYIAPEILNYKPYDHSIDWWSLGVLMFEMLTGEAPFDGEEEEELFRSIRCQRIRFPRWCAAETIETLRGFLTRNPASRLGAGGAAGVTEIKNCKWFSTVDWGVAEIKGLPPPIVPRGKNVEDNFDNEFTTQAPKLTPTAKDEAKGIDQSLFDGFDWSR